MKVERKVDAWAITVLILFFYVMGAGVVDLVLWLMIAVILERGIEFLIEKIS